MYLDVTSRSKWVGEPDYKVLVCLSIVFVHAQVKVMKYHVEAKDNAKFLGSIEKASHCIYLQVFIQQPEDKS